MRLLGVRTARATAILGLLFAASTGPVQADRKVPIEAFANLPMLTNVQVSTDGQRFALVRRHKDQNIAVIIDRKGQLLSAFDAEDSTIRDVKWISPDRALISLAGDKYVRNYRGRVKLSRLISVTADGKEQNVLMRRLVGRAEARVRVTPQHMSLLSPNFVSEDHVLVSAWSGGGTNVFKVSVENGTAWLEEGGYGKFYGRKLNYFTTGWLVNHDRTAWIRWNQHNRTEPPMVSVEARIGDGDWDVIDSYPIGDNPNLRIQGFANRPGIVYVTASRDDGPVALFEYDVKSRAHGKMVFGHDQYNVVGAEIDPHTGNLLAVEYDGDEPRYGILDPEMARMQQAVDAHFKNTSLNRTISRTKDGRGLIIAASGPSVPVSYHFLNLDTNSMLRIGEAYPDLKDVPMGRVTALTYKARDGLDIRAYLTIPNGAEAKNLPTVMLPHGGPHARDHMVFNWQAQFLANRGYAVFQPNFRGSTDRDEAFRKAGYGEWGGKMQDDVTDGVRYLTDQGIADPKRICIMGGSYGGYAALMGAVKTPDLYACAISINGVSDLVDMMRDQRRTTSHAFWQATIGTDKDELRANSPARHADRIMAPVLLIHGEEDRVVDFDHSRRMRKALRRADKSVDLVELDGDDHFLSKGETRIAAMKAVETFLTEHLGQ